MLKIKNWSKFQHFKDRKPPWIKLYRDLLDDLAWHELPGDDAKVLVMIWLIASENDGEVPPVKELAFRLRQSEKSIKSTVSRLSHWLVQDDITAISDGNSDDGVISGRYQDGVGDDINAKALTRSQETETETETERDIASPDGFARFWSAYPKKVGKPAAEKAFRAAKVNGHLPELLADIEAKAASPAWTKDGGQFVPNPATYLNQRRWEDQTTPPASSLFAGAI